MSCYTAIGFASALLNEAHKRNISVSPMKLQKLIYFSQVYSLHTNGKPLVNEDFHVWQYGPVIPSLYYQFSQYGASDIPEIDDSFTLSSTDENAQKIISSVLDSIGDKSGWELSLITHQSGAAWTKAREKGRAVLDLSDIRNDFNLIC